MRETEGGNAQRNRRVDEYTDSQTHSRTGRAALGSAYETNWLIFLTWAKNLIQYSWESPPLRHTVKPLNSGCDSISLCEIWLIFSESLLHEKQTSGEYPRQNVNDTKGDPTDYTRIYKAREPVNLIQTPDKRATEAIAQEKPDSRSAQLVARHHRHANSNHCADKR